MPMPDVRWLDAQSVSPDRPASPPSVNRLTSLRHQLAVATRLLLSCAATLLFGRLLCERWSGTEPASGATLHTLYLGAGENRIYLYQQVYGTAAPAATIRRFWPLQASCLSDLDQQVELVLLDLPFPLNRLIGRRTGIAVPAWLKQKVAIADRWETVLASLRRKTRREVLRLIGKHQLWARVVPAEQVARDFYRNLYRPYIEQRYQQGAALVSEQRFLRESRGCEVIELLQGESLLGAALLRRQGTELAVVWTGLTTSAAHEGLQGTTDALDFFSLLHGYQSGCKQLNLGGSRADLQDGLLRYKRKWGARLELGRVPQTLLRIAPLHRSPGVIGFLQRHAFVAGEESGLVAKVSLLHISPAAHPATSPTETVEQIWTEGLSRCDLLTDEIGQDSGNDPLLRLVTAGNDRRVWRDFWRLDG